MFCSCLLDTISKCYESSDDSEEIIADEINVKVDSPSSTQEKFALDTCGPLPPLDTSQWEHPIHISAHPCVNVEFEKEQPLPLAEPIPFETDLFKGFVFFRIKEVPSKQDKLHNQYFQGKKRFYQVIVQGQFKEELYIKDILIGDYYSKPMENFPRGRIGSTFMKM